MAKAATNNPLIGRFVQAYIEKTHQRAYGKIEAVTTNEGNVFVWVAFHSAPVKKIRLDDVSLVNITDLPSIEEVVHYTPRPDNELHDLHTASAAKGSSVVGVFFSMWYLIKTEYVPVRVEYYINDQNRDNYWVAWSLQPNGTPWKHGGGRAHFPDALVSLEDAHDRDDTLITHPVYAPSLPAYPKPEL